MTSWNAAASWSPVRRTLAGIVLAAALSIALAAAMTSTAFAQTPAATPAAKSKAPAKKSTPPAATEAPQAAPAPAPGAPAAQGQGQTQGGEQHVELIYSPWTKFCLKGQETPTPKEVCFTGKDARIESGMPVVAAVLIEPQGETKKILRVTLPLGMQLVHGTRVIIDQDQPMTAPYVICFTNGCMSDYDASTDMVAKLKKGQGLVVQAINSTGQPISLVLPLADFAKAYDGPPTDPKVFEEQQKKLQEELQKRADEARKKLESQQGTSGQTPAPTSAAPAPAAAPAGKTP